jgi:uncharacterized membrane protein
MLIVGGILVGAVLALRFTIFVHVPVTCGALAVAVINGMAHGQGFSGLAVTMVTIVVSLQLGYMLGVFLQVLMDARQVSDSDEVLPRSAEMSESV